MSICKFGCIKNVFATITNLSELYLRFRRFIMFVETKKSDFYELWQQRKHLKTMDICEAQPETYDEVYRHQFQTGPTPKIH